MSTYPEAIQSLKRWLDENTDKPYEAREFIRKVIRQLEEKDNSHYSNQ